MTCAENIPQANSTATNADLMHETFDGLRDLADELARLDTDLATTGLDAPTAIASTVSDLRRRIREFEPTITMIGQVKAGKTTLVNAMAGWPDLLPADVNPWTSVVTSLHLQPTRRPSDRRAQFRFFSNEEWDRLITRGGRVGELANRAGAEDELEKVRRQLDEMREKSRKRLGRRFEMMLGQTHEYEMFDEALIQRYVCLGDDFWEDGANTPDQGRFADITKSADLWFGRAGLPVGLCIQDTPGVNDTFMIREQITINALRGAKLCVMVLSAQQALSSVDLGLLRLIANVASRDVIIFVNRIDELSDPVREVPEIRQSIMDTLARFDGPTEAQIIFGSGYWASHAVDNTIHDLGDDSASALLAWAEARLTDHSEILSPLEMIWHLSGLPALGQAIAERIERGVGARMIERIETAAANLSSSLAAGAAIVEVADTTGGTACDPASVAARFKDLQVTISADLDARVSKAHAAFLVRIEKAQQTFLDRAMGSLMEHLETKGQQDVWTYDPVGLRMLLRSGYQVYVRTVNDAGRRALEAAAEGIGNLYEVDLGLGARAPRIEAPPLPNAAPPVALGQTIALDLRANWWSRFWRKRQGYQALCDDYARLIDEETKPVVEALKTDNADTFAMAVQAEVQTFIDTQRTTLESLLTDGGRLPTMRPRPARVMSRSDEQTKQEGILQ